MVTRHYVIGNPPWINWESLPEDYREKTKNVWNWYGLLEKTKGTGLGKVKRDMAMLFLARCLDRYTKNQGKLAFLIPFTVYKTQAGAGFRKFLARGYWKSDEDNAPCKVLKVHDLVTLFPFEGAINRTSLVVIERSAQTDFPVPCIVWHKPISGGIDQDVEFEEIKNITKQFNLVLIPIDKNKPESPWMQISEKAYEGVKKVFGNSPWYKSHAGVYTGLNQVYWIKVISETPDGLLITNPPLPGQKKEVRQVEQVVEKELVYPLIRGRDVKKWHVEGEYGYIIVPHDSKTGKPIRENELKIKYPKAYEYFYNFKNQLKNRSIHRLWGKGNPFYSVYDIGDYTFSQYKVVWKYVSGKISGKAEFSTAVIGDLIPNEKLMLIPLSSEDEAHYVSGVLNSSIVQLFVASYVIETAISTHITERIRIPKFDPNDPEHLKLSTLSKKAHEVAREIYENKREDLKESLQQIEEEIDETVSKLYGITEEELEEVKKCLKILREGEIEEEETAEAEETLNLEPNILLMTPVVQEETPFKIDIVVTNPLVAPINNVRLKMQFPDRKYEFLFDKIEKEKELKLQSSGLKKGSYEIKVTMDYVINGTSKKVEKTLTLFVKGLEEKKTVERRTLDELFGD